MTIKAVVFDIGGVLEHVHDDAWPAIWIGGWERRMHLPAGHVAAALAEAEPSGDMVTGEMSEAQMRELYARALGLDEDQAHQMMAEMWDAYCGELDVALRDFAAGLRPKFATAILSNSADGARREEQRRFGFEELVDVIIYSHEVGVAKPDSAIFRLPRIGSAWSRTKSSSSMTTRHTSKPLGRAVGMPCGTGTPMYRSRRSPGPSNRQSGPRDRDPARGRLRVGGR